MKPFVGKYAVITGAGNGIGRETALVLAERGAAGIVLADLDFSSVQKAAEEISAATDCKCLPFKFDVSMPEEIEALFAFAGTSFGAVHILINSAGVCSWVPMDEVDVEAWDKLMDINLRGTYLCSREAFKYMKAQKYGKIVNLSSVAARVGGVSSGINYVAAKGGVISATYALAKNGIPYNINVNGVAPGVIATDMTRDVAWAPDTTIGQPRDVATVIAFLASDDAKHVTGCTLDVNGGQYMH